MSEIINKIYAWAIGGTISKKKYIYRKAKILVNAHLIVLALVLPSAIVALFIDQRASLLFFFVFIAIGSSLLAFRRWQSFLVSGNSFILISVFTSLLLVYSYGGYESTYMVWVFMIPVYAFVIANQKSAYIWFCITLALILCILFFFPTSIYAPISAGTLKAITAVNMISFFIFIFAMEHLATKERRELIEELKLEKEQNEAIMDKIPAGLAYINKDLKLVYYNPVLARFFRLNKEEGIGQMIKDVIGEKYYKINMPYYQRALKGEAVVYERQIGTKEQPLYIRCTYAPRFNQKGEVIGFINLIEDLTKMKAAEQEKLANEKAQRKELSVKLDNRNRELASQELFITNQKGLLKDIKQTLHNITGEIAVQPKNEVRKIIQTINQNFNLEEEWDNFKAQFERIHPNFVDRLHANFPKLNTRELRHCSYLRMRLSNKEIARIQNLSLKSVEMTNYRLKKKLSLEAKIMLPEFISAF